MANKSKKSSMDKSKELFYVQIQDSRNLRKAILEASKEIIIILQRYAIFKKLRTAKLKLMESLAQQFEEIHDISTTMKIEVPKVNFRSDPVVRKMKKESGWREKEAEKSGRKKQGINLTSYDEEPELKKLEKAIAEIERKLQNM